MQACLLVVMHAVHMFLRLSQRESGAYHMPLTSGMVLRRGPSYTTPCCRDGHATNRLMRITTPSVHVRALTVQAHAKAAGPLHAETITRNHKMPCKLHMLGLM